MCTHKHTQTHFRSCTVCKLSLSISVSLCRKEDVRATEKDKVRMVSVQSLNQFRWTNKFNPSSNFNDGFYSFLFWPNNIYPLQVETYKSFRPGDIVLAKVVSFNHVTCLGLCYCLMLWCCWPLTSSVRSHWVTCSRTTFWPQRRTSWAWSWPTARQVSGHARSIQTPAGSDWMEVIGSLCRSAEVFTLMPRFWSVIVSIATARSRDLVPQTNQIKTLRKKPQQKTASLLSEGDIYVHIRTHGVSSVGTS